MLPDRTNLALARRSRAGGSDPLPFFLITPFYPMGLQKARGQAEISSFSLVLFRSWYVTHRSQSRMFAIFLLGNHFWPMVSGNCKNYKRSPKLDKLQSYNQGISAKR
jgi:hypothetical protein